MEPTKCGSVQVRKGIVNRIDFSRESWRLRDEQVLKSKQQARKSYSLSLSIFLVAFLQRTLSPVDREIVIQLGKMLHPGSNSLMIVICYLMPFHNQKVFNL